jgi:hypothetical protein
MRAFDRRPIVAAQARAIKRIWGSRRCGRAHGRSAARVPPTGTPCRRAASRNAVKALGPGVVAACSSPLPTPSPPPSNVPTATIRATGRACGANDLRVTASWQGATGSMAGALGVQNIGTNDCVVDGTPTSVRLLSGDTLLDQVVYVARAGPAPDSSVAPGPVLLRPGADASAFLSWSNWCPQIEQLVTRVVVTLAGTPPLDARPPDRPPGVVGGPGPGFGGTPRCDDANAPSTLTVWSFSPG